MSDRKIEGVEACSNHGCVFGHPGGMGTNGQCHCLDIRPPDARIRATRNVLALRAALTAERERADKEALIHRDLREELFHSTERNVRFKNKIARLVGAIEWAVSTLYEKHPVNPGNSLLADKLRTALEDK